MTPPEQASSPFNLESISSALIEHSLDGIIIMDSRGLVVEFNPSASRIFGYSREEAVGHKLGDLIVPEDLRAAHAQGMQHYLATGAAKVLGHRIEIHAINKAGDRFPVELEITAVGKHDESPLFIAHLRDITQRIDSRQALEEGKARLRQITEHIDGAVWLVDATTDEVLYVSAGTGTLTGRDPSEMRSTASWLRCVIPEDRQLLKERIRAPHRRTDIEFRIKGPDSAPRWIHFRTFPVGAEPGSPARVAGLATDITERKRVEEQLTMTSFMVEQAADAVFWIGRDARFQYVNDAACVALGWSREELVGMTVFQIDESLPPEAWPEHWQDLKERLAFTLESVHCRRDGTTFPVEVTVNFILFEGKEFNCAHVRDISDRKDSERTVHEALRKAEAANAAKDEFLSNLSHELRTPLSVVLGYAELIGHERPEDAEVQEWIHVIQSNGQLLDRLLEDILELGRLESGQIRIESRPCNLQEILKSASTTFEGKAREKGLKFEKIVHGQVPQRFDTDPERLQQVLTNLLSNAIKYTDQGRVQLHVRCADLSQASSATLIFEVVDTGPGIPLEQQSRVFERFIQTGPTRRGAREGVGLGLAIVKVVIEQLGGDITLSSEEGQGTSVSLALPLERVYSWGDGFSELGETNIRAAPAPEFPKDLHLEGRALIVDDAVELAELYASWLEQVGLEVRVVNDGLQAVEAVSHGSDSYDIILMDQRMPRMDGLTAARTMREQGVSSPIVAVTADARRDAETHWQDAGCASYLTKPVKELQMINTVRSILLGAGSPIVTKAKTNSVHENLRERFEMGVRDALPSLREAVLKRDDEPLRRDSHRLKGSAGSFGFHGLARAAADLERAVLDADWDRVASCLEELERALESGD